MVARTQGKQTPTEYPVCTPHTLNPSTRLSRPLLGTPRATAGRKPPSCQAHITSLDLATQCQGSPTSQTLKRRLREGK